MIAGRPAELYDFREELVDTVVGTVCFEELGSLEGRKRRVNLDHCVVDRAAVAVVVRRKVKCQASVGRGL